MPVILAFIACAWVSCADATVPFLNGSRRGGPTSITDRLNLAIERGTDGIYRGGGRGVLVRAILDGMPEDILVVPASLVHNDIVVPSIMYASSGGGAGNPMCPNDGSSGYSPGPDCPVDPNTGDRGPWDYAQLGAVIYGEDAMGQLFPDFEDIQEAFWGYGVFYATDANSADQRCRFQEEWNGWDCPGGYLDMDGTWTFDDTKRGAGYYEPGSLAGGGGGGGTGCHAALYDPYGIQQTDAVDESGMNLVGTYHCECNYEFNYDWDQWVSHWLTYTEPKEQYTWQGWFQGGRAPSFALDFAACWVNNPRDMINLQNAIWRRRMEWSNQLLPATDWGHGAASERPYWGWNEIPVSRAVVNDPLSWDAFTIKLPAAICRGQGYDDEMRCLHSGAQLQLEKDLTTHVEKGLIQPGVEHVTHRPGSYIVFLRELRDASGEWSREFFCQDWTSPTNLFRVVWSRMDQGGSGACYIEVPQSRPSSFSSLPL